MICYNNYAIAEIPSEFQVASAIHTTGELLPNTQTRHINYCNQSWGRAKSFPESMPPAASASPAEPASWPVKTWCACCGWLPVMQVPQEHCKNLEKKTRRNNKKHVLGVFIFSCLGCQVLTDPQPWLSILLEKIWEVWNMMISKPRNWKGSKQALDLGVLLLVVSQWMSLSSEGTPAKFG